MTCLREIRRPSDATLVPHWPRARQHAGSHRAASGAHGEVILAADALTGARRFAEGAGRTALHVSPNEGTT